MRSHGESQGFRDFVDGHSLCRLQLDLDKEVVSSSFSEYLESMDSLGWHLCLRRFAEDRPFKYYIKSSLDSVLRLFERDVDYTIDRLKEEEIRINHAIYSLIRERVGWTDERKLGTQDTEDIVHLEEVIHPDYLQYLEHVFQNLVRIPIAQLDHIHGTDKLGTDLGEWVACLDDHGFTALVEGYNRRVRNALAHGGVNYGLRRVEYIDYGGTEQLTASEIGALHDQLVDSCHTLLLALLLFITRNIGDMTESQKRCIPLALWYLRLEALHRYPGFQLERLTESTTLDGDPQLIIHASTEIASRRIQQLDGLCLAAKATGPLRGRFDRVGLVVDSGHDITGAWFLPASPIEKAYADNDPVSSLRTELDDAMMLWHDEGITKSRIFALKTIASLTIEKTKRDIQNQIDEEFDYDRVEDDYWIKTAEKQSAGDYRRWFVHAIVHDPDKHETAYLEKIARNIGREYCWKPLRGFDLTKETGLPLPPAEVVVHLYSEDQRMRNLTTPHDGLDRRLLQLRYQTPLHPLYEELGKGP